MGIFYGNPRKLIHDPTVVTQSGSRPGREGSLARWVVLPSWSSWSGTAPGLQGPHRISPPHPVPPGPTPPHIHTHLWLPTWLVENVRVSRRLVKGQHRPLSVRGYRQARVVKTQTLWHFKFKSFNYTHCNGRKETQQNDSSNKRTQDSNSSAATYLLCDPGQVI